MRVYPHLLVACRHDKASIGRAWLFAAAQAETPEEIAAFQKSRLWRVRKSLVHELRRRSTSGGRPSIGGGRLSICGGRLSIGGDRRSMSVDRRSTSGDRRSISSGGSSAAPAHAPIAEGYAPIAEGHAPAAEMAPSPAEASVLMEALEPPVAGAAAPEDASEAAARAPGACNV